MLCDSRFVQPPFDAAREGGILEHLGEVVDEENAPLALDSADLVGAARFEEDSPPVDGEAVAIEEAVALQPRVCSCVKVDRRIGGGESLLWLMIEISVAVLRNPSRNPASPGASVASMISGP